MRFTKIKKTKVTDYYGCYDETRSLVDDVGKALLDNRHAKDDPNIRRFLMHNKFAKQIVADLSSPIYNRRMYDMVKKYDKDREVTKCLATLDKAAPFASSSPSVSSASGKGLAWRYALTGVAAAAVIAIVWVMLPMDNYGWIPEPEVHHVSLTLPDGQVIIIEETVGTADLVDETTAIISRNDNSIIVEKKQEGINENNTLSYHTLNVPKGFLHDVILEDGSHIWLNSGSTLKFPSVFAGAERKVYLEGEAYFEVAPDSSKPFVVETQGQTITVLGTVFNVYSYAEEPVIYSTVVSGSIAVRSDKAEVILTSNQCSELTKSNGFFEIKTMDVSGVSAWRRDIFVFDNNTLEQVVMKISRWYDVEIEFDRQKARGIIYNGNLPKYEHIGEMLRNIEMTGQVKFKIVKDKYRMLI